MSRENVKMVRGVRIPPVPDTREHRTVDERIIVRFPALGRFLLAGWARLPRRSRLRRAMLVRRAQGAAAAGNRRDIELFITGVDPDVELHTAHAFPDIGSVFHGHEGYRRFWREFFEPFDVRLAPEEFLDFGDRVLATVKLTMQGQGSGISVNKHLFQLFTLRRGLVVREDDFVDRAKALETLGLSEQDAHR
jgi:ketosteroid isomerase-like protein